ncbi:hypothetical protein BDC45DRAFT_528982 [Circinella umbellata]|nr:hypothetical protein BDC45DRAFT_528982 [Circinella umbellata]
MVSCPSSLIHTKMNSVMSIVEKKFVRQLILSSMVRLLTTIRYVYSNQIKKMDGINRIDEIKR